MSILANIDRALSTPVAPGVANTVKRQLGEMRVQAVTLTALPPIMVLLLALVNPAHMSLGLVALAAIPYSVGAFYIVRLSRFASDDRAPVVSTRAKAKRYANRLPATLTAVMMATVFPSMLVLFLGPMVVKLAEVLSAVQ